MQILGPDGTFTTAAAVMDEAEDEEDEELGHAETYAEYMPPKREYMSPKHAARM